MSAILVAMGYDETQPECEERVRRENRHRLNPRPADHDAHVTAWRVAMWEMIEEVAWLKRQEQRIFDND